MSFVVATCSHWLIGGYDFSADLTGLNINYGSEGQDGTTMGLGTRKIVGGLKVSSVEARGYLNLGSSQNEPILFNNVGVDGVLATVFPDGINVGSTNLSGYGFASMQGEMSFSANIGALVPFSFKGMSAGRMVKATPLENWLSTALSTGANTGVSYFLGHAATSEALYAGLHITAVSTALGTSATAVIQAASSSAGGGATARVTFTAQSTKGSQVATPIQPSAMSTDQPWYRVVVTQSTGSSTGAQSNGLVWMSIADRIL